MDSLYLLQFACFIFMLINALVLGITHLHMKWVNRRYEWSRWLILVGMTGLAVQYLLQILLGFRAKSDDLGAVFNILLYPYHAFRHPLHHLIIYNRSVGSALYPFLQPEFRGFGL